MEEKNQRMEESLQEIKKQIEYEQLIETDEGQLEVQKMQKAGQQVVKKSKEMKLEMETARDTNLCGKREGKERETEIQTEKQTGFSTEQQKT